MNGVVYPKDISSILCCNLTILLLQHRHVLALTEMVFLTTHALVLVPFPDIDAPQNIDLLNDL